MKYAEEIMNLMDEINYGWIDKEGNPHTKLKDYEEKYNLQSPEELKKSKLGVCWDQVELERYYFKEKGIDINSYFIVHYDGAKCPCHTFISFKENGKYYWFEHAWPMHKGIKEFDTIEDLLNDVREKFIALELPNGYDENHLFIFNYKEPKPHLGALEFYTHCQNNHY
ncbi:MAG: hypothetical protein IK137_03025 [Bacilli bacterium]|nr:hypothetical protein [Bacilli bacterium]